MKSHTNLLLLILTLTFIYVVISQPPMDEGQRKYMDMKKQSMEIYEKSYNFLRNNLRKQSVYSYESGLQYKIIKRGSGRFHPSSKSTVTIEYISKLMDGTEFDSSFKRAPVFSTKVEADNVPKGWTEALQHMREGDQWALFVPSNLAYGERGIPDKVKNGECVIFQINLIKIESDPLPVADCNPYSDKFENCAKKDIKFIKTLIEFNSDQWSKEYKRLNSLKLKINNLAADANKWLQRRLQIMEKMQEDGTEEDDEL